MSRESSMGQQARLLLEEMEFEDNESSLEALLASETFALKTLMLARRRRQKEFDTKHRQQRAGQLLRQYPHLRMSEGQLKNVLKAVDKKRPPAWRLESDDFCKTDPIGMPGEELTLSWYAELDRRPLPAASGITDRARLRIYTLAGTVALENRDADLTYDITATEHVSGTQNATVYEGPELLPEDALWAPLGFVLAAKKQYG